MPFPRIAAINVPKGKRLTIEIERGAGRTHRYSISRTPLNGGATEVLAEKREIDNGPGAKHIMVFSDHSYDMVYKVTDEWRDATQKKWLECWITDRRAALGGNRLIFAFSDYPNHNTSEDDFKPDDWFDLLATLTID